MRALQRVADKVCCSRQEKSVYTKLGSLVMDQNDEEKVIQLFKALSGEISLQSLPEEMSAALLQSCLFFGHNHMEIGQILGSVVDKTNTPKYEYDTVNPIITTSLYLAIFSVQVEWWPLTLKRLTLKIQCKNLSLEVFNQNKSTHTLT